jgi:hypothetical protein
VAHIYNPGYAGRDGKITVQSQPRQKSYLLRLYLKNKSGMVVLTCNPSYTGIRDKRIVGSGWPKQKHESLSEK